MSAPPTRSAPHDRGHAGQSLSSLPKDATRSRDSQDIFEEIRQHYTIQQAWQALGLPGEPKESGSMRSPFRDERHPSFTIYKDEKGWKWKDFGTDEGGDVIEFIRFALNTDYQGVREWGKERFGIDHVDGRMAPRQRPAKAAATPKVIQFPAEPFEGSALTVEAFAKARGYSYRSMSVAQAAGILRFVKIDGRKCFVVTDNTRRAAEIREIKGGLFGARKAFPLAGVDKSWLPGLGGMKDAPKHVGVFIAEGATDLLCALDQYTAFKTQGGANSWIISGLLGASCKTLAPEAAEIIRGRRVRLCPDGDDAGDRMAEHWRGLLVGLGCVVDVLKLTRGKDLSDMRGEIQPEDLFQIR